MPCLNSSLPLLLLFISGFIATPVPARDNGEISYNDKDLSNYQDNYNPNTRSMNTGRPRGLTKARTSTNTTTTSGKRVSTTVTNPRKTSNLNMTASTRMETSPRKISKKDEYKADEYKADEYKEAERAHDHKDEFKEVEEYKHEYKHEYKPGCKHEYRDDYKNEFYWAACSATQTLL